MALIPITVASSRRNNFSWSPQSTGYSGTVAFGANTEFGDTTQSGVSSSLVAFTSANMSSVRDNVVWDSLQPAYPGAYNWAETGSSNVFKIVQTAYASGSFNKMMVGCLGNAGDVPTGVPAHPYSSTTGLAKFSEFCTEVATHFNSYADKLVINFGNENNFPEASGSSGYDTPANSLLHLQTLSAAVRAVNPLYEIAVPTGINMGNTGGTYTGTLGNGFLGWTKDFLAQSWQSYADWFDYHVYEDGSQTLAQRTPEQFYTLASTVGTLVRASKPTVKLSISEIGYYSTAGANVITQAVASTYYSRLPFLLRCVPGMAMVNFFHQLDTTASGYGIYQTYATTKTQTATVGRVLAHVNASTSAEYYRLNTDNTNTYCVWMNTGTANRYALWDMTGSARSHRLTVTASGSGTLTLTNMEDGTTATASLVQGDNFVTVSLTTTAKVLTADVPITIPGLGGAPY